MSIERTIYRIGKRKAIKLLKKYHSKKELNEFSKNSLNWFNKVHSEFPSLKSCSFVFSYRMMPAFIAWFQALLDLGYDSGEAIDVILTINKKIVSTMPLLFKRWFRKYLFNYYQEKGPGFAKKSMNGECGKEDWKCEYVQIGTNKYKLIIHECAIMKIAKKYDSEKMFPKLCKTNELYARYLKYGYVQEKTLGAGDDCCVCQFSLKK